MKYFDLLIIGGGPGGYSVGIAAAKKGLSVALLEKENIGGTCLNVGCIPTKYLVDKASALLKARSLAAKELFRGELLPDYSRIMEGKNEIVDKLVSGVQMLLKKTGVVTVKGEARLLADRKVICGGEIYEGRNVVIATGSVPMMIPIPGHGLCLDSTGILSLEKLPASLVVMGGGVIGLELACAFAALGSEVTVVEMLPGLLEREQKEAVRMLQAQMKKLGIRIRTGAKMLRIEKEEEQKRAVFLYKEKEEAVLCDEVLMAVGRRPNLSGIDAGALGLTLDPKGFIQVDAHQQTSVEGVYAIGDVAGSYQLAHAAYAEGEAALAHILKEAYSRPAAMPACTYTIPCIASVGLTTEAAAAAGYDPVLGSFNYAANGMGLAEGANGCTYVVMDRGTGKTLGVTIVGENASEMISAATIAVEKGLTLPEWESLVLAHPSLSEMIREAALDAFGKAVHKL